jgi:transcriptional regulator with XRE-family HTH domain
MGDAPHTPIRQLRLAAGLSLREVSRRSGINPGRLSIIERGVSPTDAEASAILAALRQQEVPS